MIVLKENEEMNGRYIWYSKGDDCYHLSFFLEIIIKIPDMLIDEEILKKFKGKNISLLHCNGRLYIKKN
jgi:Mor family transcriptional regulator